MLAALPSQCTADSALCFDASAFVSGSTLADSSGNGHGLTLAGAYSFDPTDAGGALVFSGGGYAYLGGNVNPSCSSSVNSAANFQINGAAFTAMAWLKFNSTPVIVGDAAALFQSGRCPGQPANEVAWSINLMFDDYGGFTTNRVNAVPDGGSWAMVGLVRSGVSVTYYLDGAYNGAEVGVWSAPVWSAPFEMFRDSAFGTQTGAYPSGYVNAPSTFAGRLGTFLLQNSAQPAAYIAAYFLQTCARFGACPPPLPPLPPSPPVAATTWGSNKTFVCLDSSAQTSPTPGAVGCTGSPSASCYASAATLVRWAFGCQDLGPNLVIASVYYAVWGQGDRSLQPACVWAGAAVTTPTLNLTAAVAALCVGTAACTLDNGPATLGINYAQPVAGNAPNFFQVGFACVQQGHWDALCSFGDDHRVLPNPTGSIAQGTLLSSQPVSDTGAASPPYTVRAAPAACCELSGLAVWARRAPPL